MLILYVTLLALLFVRTLPKMATIWASVARH